MERKCCELEMIHCLSWLNANRRMGRRMGRRMLGGWPMLAAIRHEIRGSNWDWTTIPVSGPPLPPVNQLNQLFLIRKLFFFFLFFLLAF